jgi:hypothetical protein
MVRDIALRSPRTVALVQGAQRDSYPLMDLGETPWDDTLKIARHELQDIIDAPPRHDETPIHEELTEHERGIEDQLTFGGLIREPHRSGSAATIADAKAHAGRALDLEIAPSDYPLQEGLQERCHVIPHREC